MAYDGSLESQQALLNCKNLSQWEHAKVHLLSVVSYETISMGHETCYYSEPEIKLEEERRMKTLNEGVEQLNTAGIEASGKLLKGDAVSVFKWFGTDGLIS